jgi:hypothetical protein
MGPGQSVELEARTLCVGVSIAPTLGLYPAKVQKNRDLSLVNLLPQGRILTAHGLAIGDQHGYIE